ncbi:hypothetical protein QJS66_19290 [Kocuria rhizophila]|nr:hypothetical protein QJS66_19290 [Kocuria rhizophila]
MQSYRGHGLGSLGARTRRLRQGRPPHGGDPPTPGSASRPRIGSPSLSGPSGGGGVLNVLRKGFLVPGHAASSAADAPADDRDPQIAARCARTGCASCRRWYSTRRTDRAWCSSSTACPWPRWR